MKNARGYTVVEVMMALAILTLSASGVIAMQKATLIANTNARNLATATALAQSWVERLRVDAQAWNEQGGTPDITQTAWVSAAVSSPPVGGGGWFTPNSFGFGASKPAGAPSADVMGVDLFPGDSSVLVAAFCPQLRLTRFATSPSDKLAAFYRVVRVEVRVVWDRQGQKLNCNALPAGWDSDVGRYGTVYLVSAVTMNAAPN